MTKYTNFMGPNLAKWRGHMHASVFYIRVKCRLSHNWVSSVSVKNDGRFLILIFIHNIFIFRGAKVVLYQKIIQRILYGSFRITSRINPRHQYNPESFSSRDDIGRGLIRDVIWRDISYYVYHILNHEKVLFCIMNLQSPDQYHFMGYDKVVMISISVTADKYSRNVLSVLYMQISFIQY